MKVTWLGQAGLLFEMNDICIMVDPYLSNTCGEMNPKSNRRVPVDTSYLQESPDVIILTHDHLDHTDQQTLSHFLAKEKSVLVLASGRAWENVRSFAGNHNYVRFVPNTEWTFKNVRFLAVKAVHSDPEAIGVILDDGVKKYYVTGDTLYNNDIFQAIPKDIHAVFLPVNGAGNNMNAADAARFAERVNATYSVPIHFGMFDDVDPGKFHIKNRVIPKIYQVIPLEEKEN